MSTDDTVDPIERDVDLAWELFEVQPTHPEVARRTSRVLAQQPGRTSMRILLAMHRQACGEVDEAREILLAVAGQRDAYFVDAARELRTIELSEWNYAEAMRWAEVVLHEEQEGWYDRMELGVATAMTGDLERGWQLLDDAVALCARTEADSLRHALAGRAIYLFQSFAPPERFIPAAEEAMRADPTSDITGGPLIYAYMHQGRFDDAAELALRRLRLDPTDGLAGGAMAMIRDTRTVLDREGLTFADYHESGVVAVAWGQKRAEILGTDLGSALAALDQVMPDELRAVLGPPLDDEDNYSLLGDKKIVVWHNGQQPGTGTLWGAGGDFRLMTSTEISAMEEEIESDPDAHPDWPQGSLSDHYAQVMTDEMGGYLVATLHHVVIRRPGADDVVVAPSLADWFWDRVASFGGRDPRPLRRSGDPESDALTS